jgi:hypothetical protein
MLYEASRILLVVADAAGPGTVMMVDKVEVEGTRSKKDASGKSPAGPPG